MASDHLATLEAGERLVYGGDRFAVVSESLAADFETGDRIVIDPSSGEILHIPAAVHAVVSDAIGAAGAAFSSLAECSGDQIAGFFDEFARRLESDDIFEPIAKANEADVLRAAERGRSTTRLRLDDTMRAGMIAGLRGWSELGDRRERQLETWRHEGWTVAAATAPLGVVGFVFEGRPNVFADAAGVLQSGNTAVFRIGSDALDTARSLMAHALVPALEASGLPRGALGLLDSRSHSAGWALFSDPRLALAVARGSGPAVEQLGAVARQSGIPVSLHGTGGAWLIVGADVPPERTRDVVRTSLDRKVCNTLNTVCLTGSEAPTHMAAVLDGLADAGARAHAPGRIHLTESAFEIARTVAGDRLSETVLVQRAEGEVAEPLATSIDLNRLGHEWEWERSPELTVHVSSSVSQAVELCNRYSPRFVVSVLAGSDDEFEQVYRSLDAPFVGDGMTRWVDGQYALGTPELGLSNWQGGRMLGRGGILSGDGIYTIRYRASIPGSLHR